MRVFSEKDGNVKCIRKKVKIRKTGQRIKKTVRGGGWFYATHNFSYLSSAPSKQTPLWDFPGGAVVKNPPAIAEEHGFEPWYGKIPHAAE